MFPLLERARINQRGGCVVWGDSIEGGTLSELVKPCFVKKKKAVIMTVLFPASLC